MISPVVGSSKIALLLFSAKVFSSKALTGTIKVIHQKLVKNKVNVVNYEKKGDYSPFKISITARIVKSYLIISMPPNAFKNSSLSI